MPDGEAEVITQPEAVNSVETEAISPGIKQRLERFEKKIQKEQLDPLKAQLAQVRQAAEENGYDLAILGFTGTTESPVVAAVKTEPQAPSAEAIKLMRLEAALAANLPREVLPLITGTDQETIDAQVEAVRLLQPVKRLSPIRPGPDGKALPTFRRSQLRDAAFMIKNSAEINKAMNEGRIIDD